MKSDRGRDRLRLFGALLVAWILIMWVLLSSRGLAQDPGPKPESNQGREGFFGDSQVDFWGEKQGAKAKEKDGTAEASAQTKDLWNEPAYSPDGRLTTYAPPKVLQELLNNPTKENALRYLEWQRERMERILKAQKAVKTAMSALREEEEKLQAKGRRTDAEAEKQEAAPSKDLNKSASPPQEPQRQLPESSKPIREPIAWKQLELVYFFSPDCPFCSTQDKVLSGLGGENGNGPTITRIDITERAEMALALGIGGTPTILISRKGKAEVLRLEGLQDEKALAAAAAGLFEEKK